MRRSWFAAAVLVLAAAVAPSATPQTVSGSASSYIFEFTADGCELAEFVAVAAALLREPFFVDADEVRGVRLHLEGKTTIPSSKFMSFFDKCVRSVDFVHIERSAAGVRVHQLVRLDDRRGGSEPSKSLRSMARVIEPSELPGVADRETLVTTTFTCKNLSASMACTALQHLMDSSDTFFNIHGSDFLVVTGTAAHVAEMVQMCERLDREATGTRSRTTDDLEQRLAALEAKVAELAPKAK